MSATAVPERSYAKANRELIHNFRRYMEARGNSPETQRKYIEAVTALIEEIGATSVVNIERTAIRVLFAKWQSKGLSPNSIRLYTCAFRTFFRFLIRAGLNSPRSHVLTWPAENPHACSGRAYGRAGAEAHRSRPRPV